MKKKIKKLRKKSKKKLLLSEIIEKEIKDNSLRQGFSKKIINFSREVSKKEPKNHGDFTHIPFVTIDGEDSKDFDDAVWSDRLINNNVKMMVAISDVSFFVSKNDPLDLEARKRGNSFYFPDRVIPMFPEELSNNICSLVPKKNRLCLIIEATLNSNGEIQEKKIHRGIIRSQARFTYSEVEDIINNKKRNNNSIQINNLYETYKILKSNSLNRGKISFKTNEYKIKINKDRNFQFEKIFPLASYKIIEEFMIVANIIVADFFVKKKIQTIFRNHDKPSKEKINNLKLVLKENNIFFKKNFSNQKDYNYLIQNIKKTEQMYINDILLKSQSKAYYDNKNRGHFGLALENYTHFTSPIRRYSDLIVHRDLIESYFLKKTTVYPLPEIGTYLTNQEKKADSLERNIVERACSLYLRNINKYQFFGIIDAIESFGIFIKSIDLPFSGMARIKRGNKEKPKSKRKIINFKIGQLVSFRIKRNNIENGKILVDKVRLVENFYEKK